MQIITENVYSTVGRAGGSNRDLHEIEICKGRDGFGFTIADSINVRFEFDVDNTHSCSVKYIGRRIRGFIVFQYTRLKLPENSNVPE